MSWYSVSSTIATMKILVMSFHAASSRCRRSAGVGEDSPQKRRLSFPGVPQAGSDCEERHHGRHHEQPKLQRPDRPTEQLLDSAIQHFQNCIHDLFLPLTRRLSDPSDLEKLNDNLCR